MRTMKVFVLSEQERKDEDTNLTIVGVFTTKNAAKEMLDERKEKLKEWYEDNFPCDWEVTEEYPILFSISSIVCDRWNELMITEKEIKV